MKKNRIDVIIPAYKAQGTMLRALSSIAIQSILPDVDVTIVNDCCPQGDYSVFVEMFRPYMSIREIRTPKNGGAGVARQYGIDNTQDEFFTCMDADDTLSGALSLEILREGINIRPTVKVCSGSFLQLGETLQDMVGHKHDMIWMFGKLYRREFIEKYQIRFNNTRANEDTGFNTTIRLLCDNPQEEIRYIEEEVYYWHNNPGSITRINDRQYTYDQCLCGWTDNMIASIEHVRKYKPFSGEADKWTAMCMITLYWYYAETVARKPVFAEQNWEYAKKFYHKCYKRIEDGISWEVFTQLFSESAQRKHGAGDLLGMIPHMTIQDFMGRMQSQEYDPRHIFEVWRKMKENPETAHLIKNNEDCGVCEKGYAG